MPFFDSKPDEWHLRSRKLNSKAKVNNLLRRLDIIVLLYCLSFGPVRATQSVVTLSQNLNKTCQHHCTPLPPWWLSPCAGWSNYRELRGLSYYGGGVVWPFVTRVPISRRKTALAVGKNRQSWQHLAPFPSFRSPSLQPPACRRFSPRSRDKNAVDNGSLRARSGCREGTIPPLGLISSRLCSHSYVLGFVSLINLLKFSN